MIAIGSVRVGYICPPCLFNDTHLMYHMLTFGKNHFLQASLKGMMIVEEASACHVFTNCILHQGADHITVCKPDSTSDQGYQFLITCISEAINKYKLKLILEKKWPFCDTKGGSCTLELHYQGGLAHCDVLMPWLGIGLMRHKVCGIFMVTLLNYTPICKWYMIRLVVKNRHKKDVLR